MLVVRRILYTGYIKPHHKDDKTPLKEAWSGSFVRSFVIAGRGPAYSGPQR